MYQGAQKLGKDFSCLEAVAAMFSRESMHRTTSLGEKHKVRRVRSNRTSPSSPRSLPSDICYLPFFLFLSPLLKHEVRNSHTGALSIGRRDDQSWMASLGQKPVQVEPLHKTRRTHRAEASTPNAPPSASCH